METFDGKRLAGSLKPDPAQKMVVQVGDTTVKLADVSLVQPFERTFWARFDMGLDFGYSMTRANSAKQLSLGTNLSYRDEHHVDVPVRQRLQKLAGQRARDTAVGRRERLSAASWAPAGASTPPRTS